jgi:ribosome-associated heat shock protein Hsp15
MEEDVRIDKWLWEVRLFKTRSVATDTIRSGKIRILDQIVKPSRTVKLGEIIVITQNPIKKSVKVTGFPGRRVGAKLVESFMEDLTPPEEYDKLRLMRETGFEYRERGIGRPTKKERRIIEILKKQMGI